MILMIQHFLLFSKKAKKYINVILKLAYFYIFHITLYNSTIQKLQAKH